MNKKVRDHVLNWLRREYDYPSDSSDEEITEAIRDQPTVWTGDEQYHRWWNDVFCVTKIDGMFIGYWGAETTGDNSPRDCGWEFDPETICEVRPTEVTTIVYEEVGGDA